MVFEDIFDMGNGYYGYINNGLMGVIDKNDNIIFENEYIPIYTKCYNNTFILKNQNGKYSIAKTDGKIYKTFDFNENWQFVASVGSNLTFKAELEDYKEEYMLYCGYSGKQYRGFLWVIGATETGIICEKYVLPDGRSFTKWEKN